MFSFLVDGNHKRKNPEEKKKCKDQERLKDVKKIPFEAREVLQHEIGKSVRAGKGKDEEVGSSCKIFSGDDRRATREIRLFGTRHLKKP